MKTSKRLPPTTDGQRSEAALALLGALAPLADLLLRLGVKSPEAESALRTLMVHRARAQLCGAEGGGDPSDSRVALLSGVHRNFVREILAQPPRIAAQRQHKAHRADRLLAAWHDDRRFQDAGGRPRELPQSGGSPNFRQLAAEFVTGVSPRVVLAELLRHGAVQAVSGRRVRALARTVPAMGLSPAAVDTVAQSMGQAVSTIAASVVRPESGAAVFNAGRWVVPRERAPLAGAIARRRIEAFVQALQNELGAAASASGVHSPVEELRIDVLLGTGDSQKL